MDKLPNGWKIFMYDDLKVNNDIGLVRNTNEQGESKEYKYLKMNNISIDGKLNFDKLTYVDATKNDLKKFSLKKNDFLFNTRNSKELVGKTCLFELDEENVIFNNNILRTRFNQNTNPHFVNYQFKSEFIQKQLESIKSGTTNVCAIYYKNLKDITIVLPPIPEQTRIVKKLDILFERIDKSIALLQENIRHTEALMASVLDEVLTSSKDSIEISKLVIKTENVNPQNNPEVKYTYIDISSVNNKTHIIENPSELLGKDAPSRARKSVIKGDIVFATTRPNLRNIAVVDSDYLNPIASTGFCVLRANSGASKDFLFLCLLSNNIQEQIKPFIRGAQYPAISDKDLLQCKIPKLNIEEQIKVSDKVMRIREKLALLSSEQQSKLSYLKTLKASLLDKAFKGEL